MRALPLAHRLTAWLLLCTFPGYILTGTAQQLQPAPPKFDVSQPSYVTTSNPLSPPPTGPLPEPEVLRAAEAAIHNPKPSRRSSAGAGSDSQPKNVPDLVRIRTWPGMHIPLVTTEPTRDSQITEILQLLKNASGFSSDEFERSVNSHL